MNKEKSFIRVLVSILGALTIPLLYGYILTTTEFNVGNMVEMMDRYNSKLKDGNHRIESIESIFKNGAGAIFFGGFVSNLLVYNTMVSRVSLMMVGNVLLGMCYGVTPYVKDLYVYYGIRFAGGMGAGMGTAIVPCYLNVISSENIRGVVSMLFGLCIVGGITVGNLANRERIYIDMGRSCVWEVIRQKETFAKIAGSYAPMGVAVFGILMLLMSCEFMPFESDGSVQSVVSWMFESKAVRSLVLLGGAHMAHHFTGINEVVLNARQLSGVDLDGAGVKDEEKDLIAKNFELTLNYAALFGSVLSSIVVDVFGRKPLLLASSVAVATAWGGMYMITELSRRKILCMVYLVGFNVGISNIPYALIGEVVPIEHIGHSAIYATTVNWIACIVSTYCLKISKDISGRGSSNTYILYFSVAVCFFAYVLVFFKETKGMHPGYQ